MASEHLQSLVAGYVLGNLDVDEAAEFTQLLADDPEIAAEVDRMQKTLELSFAVSELPPPAHLRAKILAAQAGQTNAASTQPVLAQPVLNQPVLARPAIARQDSRRPFPWNRTIHAAAAAIILALGISNYRLWQALQASQVETQRLATLVYSLQATGQGNASATVAVDPNRLEATLTVQNLPPLPPGKVYALWTVVQPNAPVTRDAKSAILTEVFTVDAQGRVSQPIVVPEIFRSADLISNVAVTVEDAAAPQNHQGKPVMIANL